ncbi:MAG: S4 domain-containing protein, partial [Thermodesulfobacteriota bacterium]
VAGGARLPGPPPPAGGAPDFAQRFQHRELPDDIETVTLTERAPTVWICHLLRAAGLTKSTSEARRLIHQGGVRLDGERVEDPDLQVASQGEKVLQVGRRRFVKVLFTPAPPPS